MAMTPGLILKAQELFRQKGGLLRTREALALGIHPRTLYEMRDSGIVEQLARGLYRLTDLPPLANPDLVLVSTKIPGGVICLISALAFHEITTQLPRVVHIAISRNSRPPKLEYPPTQVFRFSGRAFSEGIVNEDIDGVGVKVYCVEKTLADCFKYRNQIGMDTAVEALHLYRQRKTLRVEKILDYAEACRITKVITPYIEATL